MKRIDELKSIRDDLEIYAAQCDRVARLKIGNVHFDKNIYGMFGNLDARDARNIARGITFALAGMEE